MAFVDPDLKDIFDSVDTDGSGRISADELHEIYEQLEANVSIPTCRLLISLYDDKGVGSIDIHGFSNLLKLTSSWTNVFKSFDKDNSGLLDSTELLTALQSPLTSYKLTIEFVNFVIKKFANSDKIGIESEGLNAGQFFLASAFIQVHTKSFLKQPTTQGINPYVDYLSVALNKWENE